MNKTLLLLPALIILFGVSGVSSVYAKAFDPASELHGRHAQLESALDTGDYEQFVKLSADAPFVDRLTPEVFAKLVEAHDFMQEGDIQSAREIFDELDLNVPMPPGPNGHRHGHRGPMITDLTEEERNLIEQAHILRESGDDEGARAIMDSLDLPRPRHHRPRHQHRSHNFSAPSDTP